MPPKRKNNNKSTETADDSDEELVYLTMVKQLMAKRYVIKSTTERVNGLVKQSQPSRMSKLSPPLQLNLTIQKT
jgi:hypothetical protein